ncbi:hypothetical protein FNF27_01937 [Cafeteria roenbergensis]|uniref:CBS domain-containing protein n=1 Tax=Cafeteria roenbergensis TaxID=33653 RepID=A0A5A8EFM7_CAFRO|nr:hypothetical protein FNF27_01937 [Cafeteria roenbergensis]
MASADAASSAVSRIASQLGPFEGPSRSATVQRLRHWVLAQAAREVDTDDPAGYLARLADVWASGAPPDAHVSALSVKVGGAEAEPGEALRMLFADELPASAACSFLHGAAAQGATKCAFEYGLGSGVVPTAEGVFSLRLGVAHGPFARKLDGSLVLGDARDGLAYGGVVEQVFPGGVRVLGRQADSGEWVGPVLVVWPDGTGEVQLSVATACQGRSVPATSMKHNLTAKQAAAMANRLRLPRLASGPLRAAVAMVPGLAMEDLGCDGHPASPHAAGDHGPVDETASKRAPGLPAVRVPSPLAAGPSSAQAPGTGAASESSATDDDTPAASPTPAPASHRHMTHEQHVQARRTRASAEVRRLLSSVTVDHLGGGRSEQGRVATVEIDQSVEEALAVLTEHSVLSCPVVDPAAACGRGAYVAVVHIADIFASMVEVLGKHSSSAPETAGPSATPSAPGSPASARPDLPTVDVAVGTAGAARPHPLSPQQDGGLAPAARRSPLSAGVRHSASFAAPAPAASPLSTAASGSAKDADGPFAPAPASGAGSPPNQHARRRSAASRSSSAHDMRSALAHQKRLMRLTVRDVLGMAMAATATHSQGAVAATDIAGDAPSSRHVADLATSSGSAGTPEAVGTPLSLRDAVGTDDVSASGDSTPRLKELPRTAFRQLPAGCPAVFAAHVLAAGAHAVPVVNAEGVLVRVVTQADIIRFLAAGLEHMPTSRTLTLADLGLDTAGAERLVVARFDERAIDVFRRMRRSGSSAVPVLDEYGSMSANLSMTDAKAAAKHASIGMLQLPLHAFFRAMASTSDIRSPSIYCRGVDPLHRCILTLAATRIHQVYFVDSTVRPTGVLRVSDVLRVLLGEEP